MKRLLYVTPVMPALSGNGLAVRAGAVLEALSGLYTVSLHVVPLYSSPAQSLSPELARLCEYPAASRFDLVHVFRLATVPHARDWMERVGRDQRWLDIEDIESRTNQRIVSLRGDSGQTSVTAAEREARDLFGRIWVCSKEDRRALQGAIGGDVRVLPHAVRPPARVERSFESRELLAEELMPARRIHTELHDQNGIIAKGSSANRCARNCAGRRFAPRHRTTIA